ncbi:hypothetical protein QL285_006946 [Trifolium repens]|nr:hypothetical protein QL285_006946 [Trifolium repens]
MEGERTPWLLYFSGKNQNDQTFCSISDQTKSYSTRIPDHLRKSRLNLLTVQHCWYLYENMISKYVSNLFLWNPLNLKKIKLPLLKHNGTAFGNYILSCPPTTNDGICSIFLISSHCPSIFYYQLGDKQWTKKCFYRHSPTSSDCTTVEFIKGISTLTTVYIHFWEHGYRHFTLEDKKFPLYNISPAFHNGLFYFLSITGKLGVIEATIEKIRWKDLRSFKLHVAASSTTF